MICHVLVYVCEFSNLDATFDRKMTEGQDGERREEERG
jgi:hypothetical protein